MTQSRYGNNEKNCLMRTLLSSIRVMKKKKKYGVRLIESKLFKLT